MSKPLSQSAVVVGGGVVGLLSAAMLAKQGYAVTIVERDRKLGGLLGSFIDSSGASFDYGTHVPALTGETELDTLLYGDSEFIEKNWYSFPFLKSENYFGSSWNPSSPLMDLRTLEAGDYAKGMVELLQSNGADNEPELGAYVRGHFGETFKQKAYDPVFKKLCGQSTDGLSSDLLRIFGLQRVVALTDDATKRLKKTPFFDSRLAFHSYKDGSPSKPYLYPKSSLGIGRWIEWLWENAEKQGAKTMLGESVNGIAKNGEGLKLTLGSGQEIECDKLIWTVPVALGYRAARIPLNSAPPAFRTTTLFHFRFDKKLLKSEPQYLLCWDTSKTCYRITLYPNLSPDRERQTMNNLTVEALSGPLQEADLPAMGKQVLSELVEMGIVDRQANVVSQTLQLIGNTFPILTPSYVGLAAGQAQAFENEFGGRVSVLGRASGTAFFIADTLKQAYERLK